MKSTWLPVVFLLLSVAICPAQDTGVPEVVLKGFESYQKNGALAAVNAWLNGSAILADDDMRYQVTARMTHIQGVYGRMLGYEIIRTVPFTPSTKRVYAVMKFEKGVAWMFFDCYRPAGEWIIPTLDFRTKANLILPPDLFVPGP